ncbi:MAG: hypothetical protein EOO50_11580 [Flavobacterium sp.]|uniref:LexA family transcriptional regulator n=1 Tax=Flavobacterium sp. TaxID=239 RepID=UPI001229BE9A|nr:helix-turn-helix domain-containing protein [Flavobacterium sp.]RZJ65901.1 MAG: hypothetical protein EOO50_11580 [Flavobacterium sp.]
MQENKSQNAIDVIDRLKKLLKLKTDIQLSEFLNIKPNTISTWKKRNSLDYEAIISISELYELDLNEVFLNKRKGSSLSSSTPLITREVMFQYASGADREALLEIVPTYKFPFVDTDDSIAFQVVSNNMFPLVDENSFVICQSVSIEDLKDSSIAVVVSRNKGIFLNRINTSNLASNQLILTNDNDFYNDTALNSNEISEVWLVIGVISYDMNHESRFKFINDSLKKINKFIKKNEMTD